MAAVAVIITGAGVLALADGADAVDPVTAEDGRVTVRLAYCSLAGEDVTIFSDQELCIESYYESDPRSNTTRSVVSGPEWLTPVGGTFPLNYSGRAGNTGDYTIECNQRVYNGYTSSTTNTAFSLDVHVVMRCTYHVSYDAAGGTGAPSGFTETPNATAFTFVVSANAPTKGGFSFVSWLGSDGATYYAGDTVTLTAEPGGRVDFTLTAQYVAGTVAADEATYRLVFVSQYDAAGMPETIIGNDADGDGRHTMTVPDDVPTAPGHTFKGWSDSAGSSAISYQPGDKVTLTAVSGAAVITKVLYAVWDDSEPGTEGMDIPDWVYYAAAVGLILIVMLVRV